MSEVDVGDFEHVRVEDVASITRPIIRELLETVDATVNNSISDCAMTYKNLITQLFEIRLN